MFEEFKSIGEMLYLSGMNDSHSGNISVREGGRIFITARKSMLSKMKKEDIIEVDADREDDNDPSASRDLLFHRAVYKNTKAQAVIHMHSPCVMTLSLTENKILPQDAKGQSFFPQGISIVKIRQGADIDEITRLAIPSANQVPGAVVIKGYGSFVLAENIESALETATCLELSSRVWLNSKLMPQKQQHQPTHHFEHRKRSAIPPSIGVMGRRSGGYDRRDIKR